MYTPYYRLQRSVSSSEQEQAMNTKNTTKASLTRTDSKSELRKSQMQILQALADGRARTKAQIMKDSGVRNWLCSLIGAHNEEVRTKNDVRRYPSLLTLGLIQSEKIDVGGQDIYVYEITPKGRRTIASLSTTEPPA
jgi:hypothetical protein